MNCIKFVDPPLMFYWWCANTVHFSVNRLSHYITLVDVLIIHLKWMSLRCPWVWFIALTNWLLCQSLSPPLYSVYFCVSRSCINNRQLSGASSPNPDILLKGLFSSHQFSPYFSLPCLYVVASGNVITTCILESVFFFPCLSDGWPSSILIRVCIMHI